jgi:glycosyltransferase involved in cell wall biosynthesis
MNIPVSILIPTRNEEKNIRKCIQTVGWSDDIWIVDSNSTDRTAEIATQLGGKVVQFQWNGTGPRKKNWALDNVEWKYEWVLIVDADEEVTPELRDEIATALKVPEYNAYQVRYNYFFLGQLLKHGDALWKLILFRHERARFEKMDVPDVTGYDVEVHEHPVVQGSTGRLRARMIHRDFGNLFHYTQRHNIYSDWEARLTSSYRRGKRMGELQPRLFGSALQRRRLLKDWFRVIPGKPFLFFFYAYLLRGGFLDGRRGFMYQVLKSWHWYLVTMKEFELEQETKKLSGHEQVSVAKYEKP